MHHTLEVLGAVEGLLLLEQPYIASYGNATNVLAVCTNQISVHAIARDEMRLTDQGTEYPRCW
jgi:hypothetical protein